MLHYKERTGLPPAFASALASFVGRPARSDPLQPHGCPECSPDSCRSHEVEHQAAICHVSLRDPGVLDAVVQNSVSVCGQDNPRAFKKLRELLMLGFIVKEKRSTAWG